MYRTVDCNFHDDPKIRRLSSYTVAWIYNVLFTNRLSHMCGVYFLTKEQLSYMSMVPLEGVEAALSELIEKGMVFLDEEREIIFVKAMFKRQVVDHIKKGNKVHPNHITSVVKQLVTLGGSPLIDLFLHHYQALTIPYVSPTQPLDSPLVGDCHSVRTVRTEEPPPTPSRGKPRQPRTSPEESKRIAEEAMDRLPLPKYAEKYPHLDVSREFLAFKNHHLARPGNYHGVKRITDWNRSFHNWCNAEWKRPNGAGPQSPSSPGAPSGGWA